MILARIALLVAMQTGQRFPEIDPMEAYRREIAERRAIDRKFMVFREKWIAVCAQLDALFDAMAKFRDVHNEGKLPLKEAREIATARNRLDKAWDELEKAEAWPR